MGRTAAEWWRNPSVIEEGSFLLLLFLQLCDHYLWQWRQIPPFIPTHCSFYLFNLLRWQSEDSGKTGWLRYYRGHYIKQTHLTLPHGWTVYVCYYRAVILNFSCFMAALNGQRTPPVVFFTIEKTHCAAGGGLTSPMTLPINDFSPNCHSTLVENGCYREQLEVVGEQ